MMNTNLPIKIEQSLELKLQLSKKQFETLFICINNAVAMDVVYDKCMRILVYHAIGKLFKRMIARLGELKHDKNSIKLKAPEMAAFEKVFHPILETFGEYEKIVINDVLMQIHQKMA